MIIEKIFAILILLLLTPLFLLISILILIENFFDQKARGPIFYKEKRYSKGELFTMYKFRTFMLSVTEAIAKDGSVSDAEKDQDNNTKVGCFLRKYYLDELPQIINIIKGDMCFVGPRPLAPKFYKMHIDQGNIAKIHLPAGWTGPWQASKGRVSALEDMVKLENDYYYAVRDMNVFQRMIYNFKILIKTFRVIIEGKSI